jgi:excisionase family DNA binding protein
MENLFSVNQAAFILKVHPLTIRRYIREGRLTAIKVGGNVRIKESNLQDINKDFTPKRLVPKMPGASKTPVKTFTEIDPFFQLQGRGAALNIS